MKQSSSGLVWGSILLGFGLLWLAKTLGWFHIEWGELLRFWPFLLIAAGVVLLAKRNWSGAVAALLIAVAIPSAIINGVNKRWSGWDGDRMSWSFNDDKNDDDNEQDDTNQDRDEAYEKDSKNGRFVEALPKEGLKEATLHFGAGAGEFVIEGTTSQLIEADTDTQFGSYVLTTKRNDATQTSEVRFKMEGKDSTKVRFKDLDDIENRVDMKLNNSIFWNVDLGLGAGKGRFDLTEYKVKKLKIEAGAADIDLKLGDKTDLTEVEINTGVASIEVEVPESVGCELITDGALNVRELDNFEKIKDGVYRTSNYDKAAKKINIKYEGGLSRLEINRY
ncbi:MAG: hypothetical protein EAZ32_13010 [Cytophagia bacterium]|nr:MAG: hypothetical protein EAZ46_10885 [Runella sp.]TAG18682.1 MAG: hypothetical protein EAZ38_14180 [Cytophagales bacterium]TAG38232.1 MAG: hypothetical protein EAZ32_13010 [Cytophagia bacterium]TAG79614.1 MAG: hypothetical protein EAZ22_11160 [Cytophagales bacterium]